jgi:hypothetical protein
MLDGQDYETLRFHAVIHDVREPLQRTSPDIAIDDPV